MNLLSDSQWSALEPLVKKACPRLTPLDLVESQRRIDLLTAKIQSRHWMDRVAAQRVVIGLLDKAGIQKVA
ncbi:MAG TPA: hypothetical protein DCS97_09815 [Planctomycetes bacterium]|nr:hypothetical protein [Planctomycetota bacterium]